MSINVKQISIGSSKFLSIFFDIDLNSVVLICSFLEAFSPGFIQLASSLENCLTDVFQKDLDHPTALKLIFEREENLSLSAQYHQS